MRPRLLALVMTVCALGLSACSTVWHARVIAHHSCVPPGGGGRCPGPEPVRKALISDLFVSKDGNTLHGRFACGGRLHASETPRRVTLTYIASYVPQGAMACAMVPLSVRLDTALGSRAVIDGITGQHLHIGVHSGPLMIK